MIPSSRIKLARGIAISADVLQIVFFPMFAEGFISPVNDALDVVICGTLTWLVGWHLAFLPSFLLKVAPIADLAPTWTIAIMLATYHRKPAEAPPPVIIDVKPVAPPQLPERVEHP